MPQTFQVLRCYQCLVFQVHPTKKANKWKCKMCGEKQSMKRFYGLGTGKECRLHVQKLNGVQGEIHNAKLNSDTSDDITDSPDSIEQDEPVPKTISRKSKWVDYVDVEEEDEQHSPDNNMQLNETEVVLELPKKRSRKSQHVINTTAPFSSENQHLPSTEVFNEYTKDKTVESKQCIKITTKLCNTQLIDSPAKADIHKKGVLAPTNSNSRWAQYVEETENSNVEDPVVSSQNELQNDPPTLFSLLDDDSLDAVLEF